MDSHIMRYHEVPHIALYGVGCSIFCESVIMGVSLLISLLRDYCDA